MTSSVAGSNAGFLCVSCRTSCLFFYVRMESLAAVITTLRGRISECASQVSSDPDVAESLSKIFKSKANWKGSSPSSLLCLFLPLYESISYFSILITWHPRCPTCTCRRLDQLTCLSGANCVSLLCAHCRSHYLVASNHHWACDWTTHTCCCLCCSDEYSSSAHTPSQSESE